MRTFEKNKEIFDLISESIPEGIIVVNEAREIVSANTYASYLFGYEPGELLGNSLDILIPDSYRKSHRTHVSNFYKNQEKRRMAEGRHLFGLRKNREKFPIEVGLNPYSMGDGNYVLALIIDITERKKIEENQKMKTAAIDAALNGIVITDARQEDNPIIYHNPAFENITGYSAKEISDRNCRFLQGNDHDQEGIREMGNAIKNGKNCRVQVRNYKKDGTMFWNEVSINPIRDKEGKIIHFAGILNDITQRKISEQEIGHLAKIFDESLNEIYVFNAETLRFIKVNHGALKKTGYTMKEFKKLTPLNLKPEFTEVQFRKLIAPILHNNKKKLEFETLHRHKDGTTYPVEVHMQSSVIGNRNMMVAIILDISDKKNYTQKLERTVEKRTEELKIALEKEKELNDLKTKFLSMVSHEFKTPLSGILTSATLIGKYSKEEQQDKRDKHLKTIMGGVYQLTNILNDFLSIERIEKGKETYLLSDFSLSKMVNEVVYNANMILKNGQHINYPDNIEDVTVHQDERITSLTLTNLLHNAIKYSPEDTEIDVKFEITKHKMIFHIKDQGIGIPEKDIKHIFERYFRSENVLLTQGTGIGLNIVKAHLENLGGQIYFKTKENVGSTFTVELPLKVTSR